MWWPGKYDAAGRRRRPETSPRSEEVLRVERRWDVAEPSIEAGGSEGKVPDDVRPGSLPQRPVGRLIRGDLRRVLAHLPAASVDFAYLDPPFRSERDRTMREVESPTEASNGAPSRNGRAHRRTVYRDRWAIEDHLNLLDDAIQLARRLLKPTGVIAVHTDHRASHHVRCLLDEHFGPRRFVNELIWKYGLGNARAARHFLRKHDAIAVYGASAAHFFAKQRGPETPAQRGKYRHVDGEGRRYMVSYGKRYYHPGGKPLESVLDIAALSATQKERCGYPTQKPVALLRILIEAFCPPGASAVVLDPCCGSGTTAVAARRSGRSWIAIDEQALAIEVAERRLREGAAMPIFTREALISSASVIADG